eukprot:330242_1
MVTCWTVIAFVLLFCNNAAIKIADEYQQPNFLFLMVDSMDGRNLDPTNEIYGAMQMPNLRKIAEQGTQFVNHYTNSPQCVPGRTCHFTGRRTDQIRTWSNEMGIALYVNQSTADPDCIKYYGNETCFQLGKAQNVNYTLLSGLQQVGYNVYLYGRMDVGAGIIDLPSQNYSDADGWHNGPGLVISTSSANIHRPTKPNPMTIVDDNATNPFHNDQIKVNNCINKINTLKNSPTPWYMQCSLLIPHPKFNTNETWLQSVNISDIYIPTWINESSFHPYDDYMSISKNVWGEFNDSDIEIIRKSYYAMNVEADNLLGQVIDAMNANGFNLSNTIMYFTADHGEMNMDHRQIWKNSMFEGSSRIPLFYAGPGIKKQIIKNATQIIDMLPTLIELATGNKNNIPSFLSGNSLVPFLDGESDNYIQYPDFITSQYHSNMGNTGAFMVRSGKYKYIQYGHYLKAYQNYTAQLFDLEKDPNELTDISQSNSDVCNTMEQKLLSKYNYEQVDCEAKQLQYWIFNKYFWDKYNQTQLYKKFENSYKGFNQTDWQTILDWRQEMKTAPTCDQVAKMKPPIKMT